VRDEAREEVMGEKGNITSEELAAATAGASSGVASLLTEGGNSIKSTIMDKATDAAVESARERMGRRGEATDDSSTP
jgi:hypothetical protein